MFQQVMPSARMAIAATPITLASAMVNVLLVLVEVEDDEVVLVELIEPADVGPVPVLAVADTKSPPGKVVSAVFEAG